MRNKDEMVVYVLCDSAGMRAGRRERVQLICG